MDIIIKKSLDKKQIWIDVIMYYKLTNKSIETTLLKFYFNKN